MRERILLLLLPLLLVTPAAQAELGAVRRLLPPSHGALPFRDVLRPVHSDGTNFLVVLHNLPPVTDRDPMRQVLLVGPDGRQLTQPRVLRHGFYSAGWAGNYILRNGFSYQRMTSDGVLLDAEPSLLPVRPPRFGVAGTTAYLIVDGANLGALVHPNGDYTPLVNLPEGSIQIIASNGPDFAITYKPTAVDWRVRVINDRGETLHDRALDHGTWLSSDRTSYLLNPNPNDSTSPYRILDRDLKLVRTIDRGSGQLYQTVSGFGRGYLSATPIHPWTGKVFLTELRGPAYGAETGIVDVGVGGSYALLPYELSGTPNTLFVLKGRHVDGFGTATAYVTNGVSQLEEPVTPLQFVGALDRERPAAATNAKGLSLLVWHESPERKGRVYAARVSPAGTLLDAAPLPIGEQSCDDVRTSVATDGTDFLVGWTGCAEVGASLVSATGVVTPSFTRPRAGIRENHAASVVYDGESYVFAWSVSDATAITRVLRSGSATLPPLSLNVRNALLAPLPNGEVMSVHNDQVASTIFAQRLTRDLRRAGGELYVSQAATLRTLARVGDRLLAIASVTDGYTYAIGIDLQGNAGPRMLLGWPRDPRIWCADECVLLWKEGPTSTDPRLPEPAAIVGVPVRVAQEVTFGDRVVLARYENGFPYGEPVLLRGSLANPALLLYTAPDREEGGLQFFVRTSTQKRRAARP